MAYREVSYTSEKEFLKNSTGTQEKTAGITIYSDTPGINVGDVVKAGTAFYHDGTDYVPVTDETTADAMYKSGLLAHDVEIFEGGNLAGLLTAGVPDESKCTGVTDAFKEATKGRLLFDL